MLGHLRYLHEKGNLMTYEMSSAAAGGGHLECLMFLLEIGTECKTSASWNAALGGI